MRAGRGLSVWGVVLTCGLAWAVGDAVPWAAQTFQSRVDIVYLPVIVTERDGRLVTGLDADDFEIVDGGVSRPILSFARGPGEPQTAPSPDQPPAPAIPLYLGVMLDKSPSMERDAKAAADAVVRFVDAMPEAVDVTFVEFDSSVRVSRYAPASYTRLFERIREPLKGETTALFDAIGRYVTMTWERPGLHLLVVYTDGGDSGRGLNAADVQRLLRRGNVFMYSVAYLEHQGPNERFRQRATLTQLPRETGGDAFFPSAARDIAPIYDRIRAEMAARYTIGYALPADAVAGQFRRVTVRLREGARESRRVRARSGYIVPEP